MNALGIAPTINRSYRRDNALSRNDGARWDIAAPVWQASPLRP
jgi:hypothetical protein